MSGRTSTDLENGLTSEEAKKRLYEYGYNEVPEKRASPIVNFLKKFWGVSPWMLEATVALESLVGIRRAR